MPSSVEGFSGCSLFMGIAAMYLITLRVIYGWDLFLSDNRTVSSVYFVSAYLHCQMYRYISVG